MPDKKTVSSSLPPISILLKESWETLKKSVLNLFFLYLISFAIFAGLFIIGLLISVPLGAFSIISAIQQNSLTPAFFTSIGAMGIVIIALIIAAVVVGVALNAASILAVAGYKEKVKVGDLFKKGFSFVIPLFLANITTFFIIYGGVFLFILPGIIFGIALSFTQYEIVIKNKSVLSAMRRSMGIVFSNFWGVFGRTLLFGVIVMGIVVTTQIILGLSNNSGIESGIGFLFFFVQALIGWYAVCYFVTLYKQADATVPADKTSKLLIPIIISAIGWVIGIVIIGMVIAAVTLFVQNFSSQGIGAKEGIDAIKKLQDPAVRNALENPTEENLRSLLDLLPTDSPERVELERQIDAQFNENNLQENYAVPSPAQN